MDLQPKNDTESIERCGSILKSKMTKFCIAAILFIALATSVVIFTVHALPDSSSSSSSSSASSNSNSIPTSEVTETPTMHPANSTARPSQDDQIVKHGKVVVMDLGKVFESD